MDDIESLLGRIRVSNAVSPDDVRLLEKHLTEDVLLPGVRNRAAYQRHLRDYNNAGVWAHIDLNDFGQINKQHGEDQGDAILRSVGQHLVDTGRKTAARVFRKGGDEFTLWFLKPEHAETWLSLFKDAMQKDGKVGASVGLGRGRLQAESAMRVAKANKTDKPEVVIHSSLSDLTPPSWKDAEDRIGELRSDTTGRHRNSDAQGVTGFDTAIPIGHETHSHKFVVPEGTVLPAGLEKAELPDHPVFRGEPHVMLSAVNGKYPANVQNPTHEDLGRRLTQMGIRHEQAEGHYDMPEPSYILYGVNPEKAMQIAKDYGQESFFYHDGQKPALVYSNGDKAGHYHPGISAVVSTEKPKDHYTVINVGGVPYYYQAEINWDKLRAIRHKIQTQGAHPHSYDWHDEDTYSGLALAQANKDLNKSDLSQKAVLGVDTFGPATKDFGTVNPTQTESLSHYDFTPFESGIDDMAKKNGYKFFFAGGKHGKPDLDKRNYNTRDLMIWDPSEGGEEKTEAMTRSWRKIHELAHAMTYPEINAKYGEGRRIGKLGHHRTPHEAKRALEWEWLAVHKQRELAAKLGHHISDDDFNRELNTVMADSTHRAIHGTFTEPRHQGFVPHAHHVPLETAFNKIDEHAKAMGLGEHDTLKTKARS